MYEQTDGSQRSVWHDDVRSYADRDYRVESSRTSLVRTRLSTATSRRSAEHGKGSIRSQSSIRSNRIREHCRKDSVRRVASRIGIEVCSSSSSSSEDYQKYNDIQLEELELSYQAKLDLLHAQLEKNKEEVDPEEAKELVEENDLLEGTLGRTHLLLSPESVKRVICWLF